MRPEGTDRLLGGDREGGWGLPRGLGLCGSCPGRTRSSPAPPAAPAAPPPAPASATNQTKRNPARERPERKSSGRSKACGEPRRTIVSHWSTRKIRFDEWWAKGVSERAAGVQAEKETDK
eukprot:CAMPEP_0196758900 /NCGR_PEP_ID=MMETSP1091-20130531/104425_1 /TAXON_ID=302021 /ORGANISM="Rhodomonas sp., Strain CCMP768" /LENGTH=119 /DNA_ID=CAMNT_0042107737 /DNA_START=872 /DNA_END=1231 /DNA_ORIENTATION=-